MRFIDEQKYFVSEASVYRLLKAHDLVTIPAYVVIKAANEFKGKTKAINQLWQTDFTCLKITGWGWYYMGAEEVTATLAPEPPFTKRLTSLKSSDDGHAKPPPIPTTL